MKHPVDTSTWGEFKARDLFGPSKLGKYHNPKDLRQSDDGYEYICATTMNNGVNKTLSCVIGDNLTIPFIIGGGLSLTPPHIIAWGKQSPYFTYHENPCVTSQGMYFVEVKNKTRNQIHFLITVLNKISSGFGYTNCLTGKIFDELIIPLPLKPNTNPDNYTQDDIDWDCMERFMSRVQDAAKERLANLPEPGQKSKTPVDVNGWGEFKLTDIAKLTNGNKFDKNKMTRDNTSINFVSRTGFNNGVSDFVDKIDGVEPYPAGAITLALGGSAGSTFVQTAPFYTGQNVGVIEFENKSFLAKQFVATVLAKTCNIQFSAFKNEINKHFKRDLTIPLPLKSGTNPSDYTQDDIDWDYMERFMRQIQTLAKNRLGQLTQTQIPNGKTSDEFEVFVLRKCFV